MFQIKRKKTITELCCDKINDKCMQSCTCVVIDRNSNDITRMYDNNDLYNWEVCVYLKLLGSKITPLVSCEENKLCYVLNEYISLRQLINKDIKNINKISLVLNELYSFINTFKKYNFIHGNLHIDNIFIKELEKTKFDFKVIDYANSYILNSKSSTNFYRSSFLGEYDDKEDFLKYWDFFTVYVSLKNYFKNNPTLLFKLHTIVECYIPSSIFKNMLKHTIYKKINEPFSSRFF